MGIQQFVARMGAVLCAAVLLVGCGKPSAFRETRARAERGDAEAQWKLGRMYETGEVTAANPSRAVHWYRMAAEQGFAPAQNDLGVALQLGRGVPPSAAAAAHWWRRAAARGHPKAQAHLGTLLARGDGVARDDVEAYQWLSLAVEQRVETATNELMAVAQRLTPAQLAEAERRSRALLAKMSVGP